MSSKIRDLVALDMAFAFLREANLILTKQGKKEIAAEISGPMKKVNTIRMRAHRRVAAKEDAFRTHRAGED